MALQNLNVSDTHPLQDTTGILRSASLRQPLTDLKQDRRYSNLAKATSLTANYLKWKVVTQAEWVLSKSIQAGDTSEQWSHLAQLNTCRSRTRCKLHSFQQCHMHQTHGGAMIPKLKLSSEGSSKNKWWQNGCFQKRVIKTVKTQRNQSLKRFVSIGSENSLHKQKDVTPQ